MLDKNKLIENYNDLKKINLEINIKLSFPESKTDFNGKIKVELCHDNKYIDGKLFFENKNFPLDIITKKQMKEILDLNIIPIYNEACTKLHNNIKDWEKETGEIFPW